MLPFANGYVRSADLNTKGPVIIIASLIGISLFNSVERAALGERQSALIFWLTLTVLLGSLRFHRRRRERGEAVEVPDVYPSEMARLDLTSVS
jgi:hypothetical protein